MKKITYNYINNNTIPKKIKDSIDIVDAISDTVHLSRKGNTFWGLCPFHSEKTPSFSVSPDKQMFYCFGCHEHGDAFDFVMKINRVDFKAALDYLEHRTGLSTSLTWNNDQRVIQQAQEKREKNQQMQMAAKKIVEEERSRLIGIEQMAIMFMDNIRTPQCMGRPGPMWAANVLPRVEDYLNRLEQADDSERASIALEARKWKP